MKRILQILLLPVMVLAFNQVTAQCYSDNCDDDNDISVPGCCTATTAGMTWSGYGDIGCVNMGTATNPDVWISFTAPTTGYIQVTIDNITQSGMTNFVVFDHQNAEVCSSLNSFGLLAGYGCNNLPGDGVGGVTSLDTVEYMVEAGERYWLLVSADVQNGATPGSFIGCVNIVPPPPPSPPVPGQDCPTAAVLCSDASFSQGTFTGIGAAENTALNGCLDANERQSKWYTFTVSQAGTFGMIVDPVNNTHDYDWAIYNTTTACYTTGVTLGAPLSCNFSACAGSTGITNVANPCTTYGANDCGGPPGCQAGGINNTMLNLVAGQTYTIIIDNFTVGGTGFAVDFLGTAIIAPQDANAQFTSSISGSGCAVTLNATVAAVPNYVYSWDFGDGTTYTGSTPPTHYYSTPGNYVVELTVTDALGCSKNHSIIIDVAVCTPLPIGLSTFQAKNVGQEVQLEWATASENNNDYFIVERSVNGFNWEAIGTVDGAGSSTQTLYYTLRDEEPFFPISYYRLKQVDFDGAYTYSQVVSASNENMLQGELISNLAPVPAKDVLNFNYSGKALNSNLQVYIFNELGQMVKKNEYSDLNSENVMQIDLSNFDNGVYQIHVVQNDKKQIQKFTVMN